MDEEQSGTYTVLPIDPPAPMTPQPLAPKPTDMTFGHTPTIAAFADAFAKAQAEFELAIEDALNPFYRSNYARLKDVSDACLPALNKQGIGVLQPFANTDRGIKITTLLMHKSGEQFWCTSEWELDKYDIEDATGKRKASPIQMQGKTITYGRRYSLQALVSVVSGADEDDDGEGARRPDLSPPTGSIPPHNPRSKAQPAPKKTPAKTDHPAPSNPAPHAPVAPNFGGGKGKLLTDLTKDQLDWYAERIGRDCDDPKLVQFQKKNEALLNQFIEELDRRRLAKDKKAVDMAEPSFNE